jgi:hypothetical protein
MRVRFLPAATLFLAVGLAPVLAESPDQPAPKKSRHHPPRMVLCTYNVADLVIPLDNPDGRGMLEPPAPVATAPVPGCGLRPAPAAGCPCPRPAPMAAPPAESSPKTGAAPCVTCTGPAHTLEARLIQLIESTIAPRSWETNGGWAQIQYYPLGMTLLVTQTPDAQEQIADLLAALRRQQATEVVVEVRLVSVADGLFERVGVDFNANHKGEETLAPAAGPVQDAARIVESVHQTRSPVCITQPQVARLLEAAQGDQRTNVLQAPKLTVANGQAAVVNVTDQRYFVTRVGAMQSGGQTAFVPQNEAFPTGLRMSVQPVVSADRRAISLNFKLNQTVLTSPVVPLMPITMPIEPADDAEGGHGKPVVFTQFVQQPTFHTVALDQTFTVPDGGTAVFNGGTRVTERRAESGPPVLSKVPYVSRMFKNVGYGRETEQILVMVTPRIIVHEEEEQERPAPPRKSSPERRVATLLKMYHRACAAGDLALAKKMALRALAVNPACFSDSRPPTGDN